MVSLASPAAAMPPPPTPLRRPSLGLKRNSSFLDTDDEAGLSSSTKKLKVTFSPTVDVRIVHDAGDKSYDLVKEEVFQAIERHLAPVERRDDTQYNKIIQLISYDPQSSEALSPRLFKKYLVAIDSRVSRLGECGRLFSAIASISWLGRDESFVEIYVRLLCNIAGAHGKFIVSMLDMLVANFARLPSSAGRLPDEMPVSRQNMFNRVHMLIKLLLRTVPSGLGVLASVIRTNFPNDSATSRAYIQYQKHLMQLAETTPELRSQILALAVQKLVDNDEQVQQDIEDMEEEAEEKLLQRPSSRDGGESDDSSIDSLSESEETTTEDERRLRELRLKVAKMDGALDLLFEYYTPRIDGTTPPLQSAAFKELIAYFGAYVMPHRCRHAQFLQFHFAQISPAYANMFVQHCLNLAMNKNGSSRDKATACAYIASFVARGKRLSTQTVRDVVAGLCKTLNNLRIQHEPTCRNPDRRISSGLYYAVAQALFYVFCFRWRDLVVGSSSPDYDSDISEEDTLADGHELIWLPALQETLRINIHSKLNPLKVCAPSIVQQFADISQHLGFLYVFSLLETNKKLRLGQAYSYYGAQGMSDIARRETVFDRKTGEAHHQLEAYFPFDPYHLPKSKHWVAGGYNEWKAPRGMRRDEDDEEEDEEQSEDEEEDESDEASIGEEEDEDDIPLRRAVAIWK